MEYVGFGMLALTTKPGPIYLIMALFGLLFVGFGAWWLSMMG